MKFAYFDDKGLPVAFYDDAIMGPRRIPTYALDEDDNLVVTGDRANPACDIPGNAVEITDAQIAEFDAHPGARRWDGIRPVPYVQTLVPEYTSDVDSQRDKRIIAGFLFKDHVFQADEKALRNINGTATGAALALIQQVQPGDLRWHGGDTDFGFIASDNTVVPMDVLEAVAFGRTALEHVSRLTMKARDLKNRMLAGETINILDNNVWDN